MSKVLCSCDYGSCPLLYLHVVWCTARANTKSRVRKLPSRSRESCLLLYPGLSTSFKTLAHFAGQSGFSVKHKFTIHKFNCKSPHQ